MKNFIFLLTIFGFSFGDDGAIDENTGENSKNSSQTDSCLQYENKFSHLNDLRTRNCMCDRQCWAYNDCCKDSKYYLSDQNHRYDKKFTCVNTPYNGNIYMIRKCPSNYPHNRISKYCQTNDAADVAISVPVTVTLSTSIAQNITYRNMFCAFCHDQTKFQFWNVTLNYANITKQFENSIHSTSFQCHIKADQQRIVTGPRVTNSTYECRVNAIIPIDLSPYVRYCRFAETRMEIFYSREQHLKDNLKEINISTLLWYASRLDVDLNHPLLPKINHCDYVPLGSTGWELFCSDRKLLALKTKDEPDIEACFFKTLDGELCMINKNLTRGVDFEYIDEETIVVKKYGARFKAREWVRQTNNTIFLCGVRIHYSNRRQIFQKFSAIMTEVLVKVSLIFLVAHLILSWTDNKLQSLPNRIMFSYSVTLFAIYVTWEMSLRMPSPSSLPCIIVGIVEHYLCLSCFTWLLIASYDCWLVVCRASQKFQNYAGKTRSKRYLAYCFWGWISPLSIMAIALYFEMAPNSVVPCYLKPGYGRLGQCFIGQQTPANYFYQYPSAVVTCLNIALFLRTSYQLFASKRKGIPSTVQSNSYLIFIKLSLNMGIVLALVIIWTIYLLVTETDYIIFHLLQHVFEGSQGIFMFFAFSFDKNQMHKILSKFNTLNGSNSV